MTVSPPLTTDVVIIGAGPVGLFAIFQCGMLGLRAHVVDTLDTPGGQCAALYPEKPIYDIPSRPEVLAGDLIAGLEAQARPFDPVFHLGQTVETLEGTADEGFTVTTSAGTVICASAVMIAAGGGSFGPNRPPLDGLSAYEGHAVVYSVQRKEDFRDRRVVIAGGGDSAVDWAVALTDVAASVAVVHRRPKFRAAPDMVARMTTLAESGRIDLVTPYQLAGLDGDGGALSGVLVRHTDGSSRRLEADILLPLFGLRMDLGPLASWGLGIDKGHVAVNPATLETARPGVFAIGDITHYPGKLKLILCGFAEAAMAAHQVFALARPGEALHFEHSTSKPPAVPRPCNSAMAS